MAFAVDTTPTLVARVVDLVVVAVIIALLGVLYLKVMGLSEVTRVISKVTILIIKYSPN